ncbi:MAG: VWA domain-containing protein [Chloroflexi bacterium]|nr:VWA domain-containing protein [Chloroflexota bacterium]
MDLAWNWLLLALLVVPLFIAAYLRAQRRRKRFTVRYSSLMVVKVALRRGPGWRRHIPPVLYLLALTAMLIGAARPFADSLLPKQEATVILAMDVSSSMSADDIKPSRLDAAKTAARAFVQKRQPTTRVGVVAFSGTATLVQIPTVDHDLVLAAINRLVPLRDTAIGSAILTSLDAIFELVGAPSRGQVIATTQIAPLTTPTPVPKGNHIPAVIVLLTDGQNTWGPPPLVAAQQAAERGVRVYTVGFGTQVGAPLRGGGGSVSRTHLDEPTLQGVAQMTGARYFYAEDESALVAIYNNLDTQLILRTERIELAVAFAAVAALLLVVGGALSLAWFDRLP